MPLWKTINQDYCVLNELCDVHYPRLMSNMRRQSEAYAKQRSDSNQTAPEAPGSRIAVLEASIQELAELKCQLSSVVERVRNNLLAYALSEDFSEHELAKVLQPVALRAYAYHVADLLGKSKPKDPYTPFHAIIQTLEQASNTYKIVKLLHYPTITKTAFLLYEKTKGKPQKDLSKVTLPNWPGMYCCFQSLRKINDCIKQEATRSNGGLCAEEASFLETKMQIIKCFLFNSPEAHQSIQPKQVEELDFDVTPFLHKQEYELMFEFLSASDYVMDSFKRLVTDHTPYTIHKIDGDGNCFFRAVVRHTYPNITRAWEDALSLGLRKRLNTGSEREMQAHGKGAEYQFHGFVIENVNDSLTMAKAGVWADHIQVQKLSQKLQRPLELFTFDDVALRMDRQGKLRPGKDYMIGTEFGGPPISLYYTPSPGHYEVISLPQPAELQTSVEEDLQQIESIVSSTPPPHLELPAQLLCSVYFRLEAEVGLIEECARSGWLSAREIKQAIDAELRERAGVFFARFFRYRQIILHLGVPYLLKYLDQKPDFNLHAEVLYQLLEPKPDSIESLLTRLSSRVTHACPAGVLATAQRVSAAAQQHQQPTTIVIGSPPAPPAAPVKATPTPTPALRPTTAITTSPLLLAAYNTPMMNPSAQVYCTLPPPREGPLLASPHTSVQHWVEWCSGIPSDKLQLRDSYVTGGSLKALAEALADTNFDHVMLYRCRFDASACQVLGEVNAWPLSLKRVELHNCMLEDRQVVSLNNRVKPLGCTEVPRMQ